MFIAVRLKLHFKSLCILEDRYLWVLHVATVVVTGRNQARFLQVVTLRNARRHRTTNRTRPLSGSILRRMEVPTWNAAENLHEQAEPVHWTAKKPNRIAAKRTCGGRLVGRGNGREHVRREDGASRLQTGASDPSLHGFRRCAPESTKWSPHGRRRNLDLGVAQSRRNRL